MVDKRYNRWKNRKRRKAKRYSPTPGDSSSEEEKVGGANNTATPIEMESEQRTYMRIRRRKRLPDEETNPHPVEYSEEYLHYDGSAEVTTSSSSDKDGRHSQFQEFAKYRQYQKQQQLSKTGHSNSSIESSASDKINVILNDKGISALSTSNSQNFLNRTSASDVQHYYTMTSLSVPSIQACN